MRLYERVVDRCILRMTNKWEEENRQILAGQQLPDGVRVQTDLPYLDDGLDAHRLDVYYPTGLAGKRLPVVVDIHSGGFIYGYKELNRLYGCELARRGFVVFNINYRLAGRGKEKVPALVQDVAAALRWIQAQLPAYPADPSNLFITGESAGGVLAVLAALLCQSGRLQTIYSLPPMQLPVRAVGAVCGMLAFQRPSVAFAGLRSVCFEKGYRNQPAYQALRFDRLPETGELPPCYLCTGKQDYLRRMTLRFAQTLRRRGVEYQLQLFPKGRAHELGHIFSVLHPEYPESREQLDGMSAFFHRHLHG